MIAEYGSVAGAETSWGYDAAETCSGFLCPPDDDIELCCESGECVDAVGTTVFGAWQDMAHDYRRFMDSRYQSTLGEAVARINTLETSSNTAAATLKTSGFSSTFANSPPAHRADCQGSGYRMDPRMAARLFDYAAIHIYPWSNIGVTFDSTSPTSDERERYHRLRFLLDYMRRGADGAGNPKPIPVVLEESGYPVCTEAQETSVPLTCAARESVQVDVVGRVALAIAEVQANGGLYFTYRDRFDNWRWGAVALDESQNLVYPDLPLTFANIRGGRGSTLATQGTAVSVDPFAEVDFYGSLLQSMASYKTEATSGGSGNGSVEITVPTEPGSP